MTQEQADKLLNILEKMANALEASAARAEEIAMSLKNLNRIGINAK